MPSYQARRVLALHTHLTEYLQVFLTRCSTPTRQYPKTEEALREVETWRMKLEAEQLHGAPPIRNLRQAKKRS